MKTIAKIIKRLFSKHTKSETGLSWTSQMETDFVGGRYLMLSDGEPRIVVAGKPDAKVNVKYVKDHNPVITKTAVKK